MEKIIKDLDELRELSSRQDGCDCYIKLRFGLRSSKHINYENGKWYILNLIDDSEDCFTDEEMTTKTNIQEALDKRALILDD